MRAAEDAVAAPAPAWRGRDLAWLLLAVAIAAVAHAGMLGAYFYADDFLYLFRLNDAPLGELLLMPNAGHLLVLRNLLFLATWQVFGTDPQGYYATVFLTHLANVALLFALLRHLTGAAGLAGAAAALWGSLAVHAPTLGWYAVYGQVIAVTLLAAVLLIARTCRTPPSAGVWALLAGLLFGAGTCFGSAMAAVLAMPLALPLLRPGLRRGRLPPFALVALALLALWYVSQQIYADPVHLARLLAPPGAPPPGVAPSVLASLRELYLSPMAALMALDLFGHGLRAIALGPWAVPPATEHLAARLLLPLAAAAAALAVWHMPAPRRRAALALALLLAAAYAAVALGRAHIFTALRDGAMPPVIDRYHYLPAFLLVALLALCADEARRRVASIALWRGVAAAVPAALLALLIARPIPHDRHDDLRARVAALVAELDASIARAPAGGLALIPNRGINLMMLPPPSSFPGLAALFVIYFPDNTVAGRRVLFDEPNEAVRAAAERGRRTRSLFISGDDSRRPAS